MRNVPDESQQRDRAIGAFLGLAVGDAIGTTVEFRPRGTFEPLCDMIGGGPFRLAPGQWTDDTSMALCLAESLQADANLNPKDLMQRFAVWMEKGVNSSTGECFDIGITTRRAISRFLRTGEPISGSTDPNEAGNGSIMRLAPVATRWWRDSVTAERIARLQGQTTHGAAEAVDACLLLARILCRLIATGEADLTCEDSELSPAIREIGAGAWRGKRETEIRSTGYVVHTLEAAVWSVNRAGSFQEAVLGAVNLGDDADTVGAVTGQIAGALWGARAIPAHWVEMLWESRCIRALAERLSDAGRE